MAMISSQLRNIFLSYIVSIKRMSWAGHVELTVEKRNAYGILVGKPEGKRPQGSPRRTWMDSIKIDLR
jgi:hypothetical protein